MILITGENKRCFSGFHAANLAAAFAAKGVSTRLFDLSGLLPNGGFFMLLPPERYIQVNNTKPDGTYSGLAGVKVSFSLNAVSRPGGISSFPRIGLIHLPPIFPEEPFREGIEEVKSLLKAPLLVLLLKNGIHPGEGTMRTIAPVIERLAPRITCVLRLNKRIPFESPPDCRLLDLGSLPDWELVLRDRVPIVVRVPKSALSRAYLSVCESLLNKIHQFRRKSGAVQPLSVSPGVRPR